MIYLIIAFIVVIILVCLELVREQKGYVIRHYQISSEKLSGNSEELKLVFLSDLHGHEYGKNNERLIKDIEEIAPAAILCGGDMVIGKENYCCDKVIDFIGKLTKIAPVYHANGNHEQRLRTDAEKYGDIYEKYKEALVKYGVIYMENETQIFEAKGKKIKITGVELPSYCYAHNGVKPIKEKDIENQVGKADTSCYNVLMAHHPAYVADYKEWGADLVLSGHLHGGVMRLPILGGVISPQMGLFPKYSGDHYKEEDVDIVVSKGLGTHTIHIRLFNPAELIVLHLNGR